MVHPTSRRSPFVGVLRLLAISALAVLPPAKGLAEEKRVPIQIEPPVLIQPLSRPSCITPPAGMVAWWPFDETSGTTANDLRGVPNNGIHQNGPTPTAGKVAGALRFDGVDDHVRVPDHPELNVGTGNFTIDA